VAIVENVIGLGAVGEHVLVADGIGVLDRPTLIAELRINLDAGERLVGRTHADRRDSLAPIAIRKSR